MTETVRFDPAEVLTDRVSVLAYLDEAFATGDSAFVEDALAVVARARGMEDLLRDGRARAEMPGAGDQALASVFRVLQALGAKLSVSPAE